MTDHQFKKYDNLHTANHDSEIYRLRVKKDYILSQWYKRLENGFLADKSPLTAKPFAIGATGVLFGSLSLTFMTHKTKNWPMGMVIMATVLFPFSLAYKSVSEREANAFINRNFVLLPLDLQKALKNYETNEVEPYLPKEYDYFVLQKQIKQHFELD